jgi:hypothetical protein
MNKLKMTQDIMNEVADTFSFDPTIKLDPRGRSINQIEKEMNLTTAYRCIETTLIIAKKLQTAGLEPFLIHWAQNGLRSRHFDVGIKHDGKHYSISFDTNQIIPISEQAKHKGKQNGYQIYPLKKLTNQRIESMLSKPEQKKHILWARLSKLRPRLWPLKMNQRKNEQKAKQLTEKIRKAYKK